MLRRPEIRWIVGCGESDEEKFDLAVTTPS
jgi:hypothetical protein